MSRLSKSTCDRCKKVIYGDNYGPLGHKCLPPAECWAVVNKLGKWVESYPTRGAAELNAGKDYGERVVRMVEEAEEVRDE